MIEQILLNDKIAKDKNVPICQDTGTAWFLWNSGRMLMSLAAISMTLLMKACGRVQGRLLA